MKIGTTERGDAGLDLSWVNKANDMDALVLSTKNPTDAFCQAVLRPEIKAKTILHITITGYGGTILEPNVPNPKAVLEKTKKLVADGFPRTHIVIRVDPIIPTTKGIHKANQVMQDALMFDFTRFRISVIDMYPHVRDRFKAAKLPLPYGDDFAASPDQFTNVEAMLFPLKMAGSEIFDTSEEIRIEACAEPMLRNTVEQIGCISVRDIEILFGADNPLAQPQAPSGKQRSTCLCHPGKTELLANRHPCPHKCLYCYWKD